MARPAAASGQAAVNDPIAVSDLAVVNCGMIRIGREFAISSRDFFC
jgi:hypothetical protein